MERGGGGGGGGGLGGGGVPIPHSRSFYTTILHPELLPSLTRILFLSQYLIPCQDLGETRFPSRGSTVLAPPRTGLEGSNPVSLQEFLRFPESRNVFP